MNNIEKPKAILTVGISASGKSTWAKEFQNTEYTQHGRIWQIICRDDFRAQIQGRTSVDWRSWKKSKEKEVNEMQTKALHKAAKLGTNVIIADTNLSAKTRNNITQRLENLGYEVSIREFPITIEEAWERDAMRASGVGHSVIANQYKMWLAYKGRQTYRGTPDAPKAIIVDIDGTIAHIPPGGRGWYDYDRTHEDIEDEVILTAVAGFRDRGYKIVLLTGRSRECEKETINWLKSKNIEYDELLMRETGDTRCDTIVKEEIFWRDVAPKYDVKVAFDDRPRVIRLYQELGIKTFALGNPWIEF